MLFALVVGASLQRVTDVDLLDDEDLVLDVYLSFGF
jgi:hypothetical protein